MSGGREQPIPIAGDLRLTQDRLSPSAIAADGRIAVRVGWKDSWFWPAAVLDPRTGEVTPISKSIDLDMMSPGWTPDGRIVALGLPTQSTMWRFRPQTRP